MKRLFEAIKQWFIDWEKEMGDSKEHWF